MLITELDTGWERNIQVTIIFLTYTNSFNSQSNIVKLVLMSSTCTEDHVEIQRIEVTYDKSHSQTAVAPGKTGMLLRNLPMFSQEISYQKSYTLTGEKKMNKQKSSSQFPNIVRAVIKHTPKKCQSFKEGCPWWASKKVFCRKWPWNWVLRLKGVSRMKYRVERREMKIFFNSTYNLYFYSVYCWFGLLEKSSFYSCLLSFA